MVGEQQPDYLVTGLFGMGKGFFIAHNITFVRSNPGDRPQGCKFVGVKEAFYRLNCPFRTSRCVDSYCNPLSAG